MAPTYDELLALVAELQRENDRLRARVDELSQALQGAQRAGKRQAAPFSKNAPKAKPKTPGRKRGEQHGRHGHRLAVPDEQIDEHLEAPLPDACPDCGGKVVETHQDHQDQTELPLKPQRRRFHIHCGHCQRCGQRLRGRHPQQTSDATGAAASQVGPQAQALVVYLNKHSGLSHGKTADVLGHLGIPLSRGASAQLVLRAGRKMAPVYREILNVLPQEDYLTPDETGWRLGGLGVWLHAWVGVKVTAFAIDSQRGAEPLAKVIGWDWSGTLIHDGAPAYDRFMAARHQQCVFHVLHRAHNLEEIQVGRAKVFPRQVIDLFQAALKARDRFLAKELDQAALTAAYDQYVDELLTLTRNHRVNADNERLAKHLYGHGEQWLTFLEDPLVPATNHRAEQALKVPIVNRKVWGGNRTQAGAAAQCILQSTLATCKQQAQDFVQMVADRLRGVQRFFFGTPAPLPAATDR